MSRVLTGEVLLAHGTTLTCLYRTEASAATVAGMEGLALPPKTCPMRMLVRGRGGSSAARRMGVGARVVRHLLGLRGLGRQRRQSSQRSNTPVL